MSKLDPRLAAFLERCDSVAVRLQITRKTLSSRLLLDGKRLDQIALGASDIGIARLAQAEREISALEGATPTPQAMARARRRAEAA